MHFTDSFTPFHVATPQTAGFKPSIPLSPPSTMSPQSSSSLGNGVVVSSPAGSEPSDALDEHVSLSLRGPVKEGQKKYERRLAKEEFHQQLVDRYMGGEMGRIRKSHHLSTSAALTLFHPSSTPPQTITLLKTSTSVPEILSDETWAAINAPVPSPYLNPEPSTSHDLPTTQHFVPPRPAMKQKFPKPCFKSSDVYGDQVWTDEQKHKALLYPPWLAIANAERTLPEKMEEVRAREECSDK